MGDELAVIEATPEQLADAIRTAALYGDGNDPHEEMFVRVESDCIETPASAAEATQSSYCSIYEERFQRLSVREPTQAVFPVADVLDWLAWFDQDSTIRVGLVGESGAEVVSEVVLAGEDRTATIACLDDPGILGAIQLWLPDRFENGTFLDTEGNPVPTHIETTATQLQSLVQAVENAAPPEQYPVTTSDGTVQFEVGGDQAHASGTLDATVEGPDVSNQYGPGFARVVRTLSGPVTLQTGPGMDLAIVSDRPNVRLRYHLASREA